MGEAMWFRKSLAGQYSGTSSPGAGLWVTSSSPCSLGAGKIIPNHGARCWGPLGVSQVLPPFWLPSERPLLASLPPRVFPKILCFPT